MSSSDPPPPSGTWPGQQPPPPPTQPVGQPPPTQPVGPPPGGPPPGYPPGFGGPPPGGDGGNKALIGIIAGVVALLAIGALVFFLTRDDDEDVEARDRDRTTTTEEETTTTTTVATTTSSPGATVPAPTFSGNFTSIQDDSGNLTVEVPVEWSDVDGRPLPNGNPNVQAAPDLQEFRGNWTGRGLTFSRLNYNGDLNAIFAFLAETSFVNSDCTSSGRQPYDDGVYTGQVEIYQDCGGTTTDYYQIVASPDDQAFTVEVGVQVEGETEEEIYDHIVETFLVGS